MTATESSAGAPCWVPLSPIERRVVGVLAEKGMTTPDQYPLSVLAAVAGCNQKSNRDPITNYDQDDVEETLHDLRKKGAAILVETAGGRVTRWKHTLYTWFPAKKTELAVIVELLLRGPQTTGELRGRASRMEPIHELPALEMILAGLEDRGLVVQLSPKEQKRGVVVTHGLYPPAELEKVRQAFAASGGLAVPDADEGPARRPVAATATTAELVTVQAELAAVRAELAVARAEVGELRGRLDALAAELRDLKSALGV
ncbi:hypothetical protein OJF2_19110 [Aquisphaera giovannonii]|uniref:Uncharacterized protein n=1 Tax=Aquisphaera giovannonii TaxID=406548 RepID=A0A5B9W0H3_9BACT|nr:DUF480 domain-containing protein [Aquisphaera giovannonii]QEH33410.1 hypothetical protein OJF2_19110 [Aquisphaera giovannonii]